MARVGRGRGVLPRMQEHRVGGTTVSAEAERTGRHRRASGLVRPRRM